MQLVWTPRNGTAQIIFKQVFPNLIRILFYYTAHFLNPTLIKCMLFFIIANKNYLCSRFMLVYRGAWRLYQHFKLKCISEVWSFFWKINCSWNLAQRCLQISPRGPCSAWLFFLEQCDYGRGARSVRRGRKGNGGMECCSFLEPSLPCWLCLQEDEHPFVYGASGQSRFPACRRQAC